MRSDSESFFKEIQTGYTFDDLILVPDHSDLMSRKDADTSTKIVGDVKVDVPIISANMDSITEHEMLISMIQKGATGALHRFMSPENIKKEIDLIHHDWLDRVGISVGADKMAADDLLRNHLFNHEYAFIIVDIAHGDHEHVENMVIHLKNNFPSKPIIAGNVCTASAAKNLIKWGVDGIKVGVGPGSMCTTRIVTGCGYPQLSSIKMVADVIKQYSGDKKVTLIADGGIKYSGDIVKALAMGADSVMIGGMFKATKETPGDILTAAFIEKGEVTQKKMKLFKGMASIDSQIKHLNRKRHEITAEGVATVIPCRGSVHEVMIDLIKGIRSGLSYCGCHNIAELQEYGSMSSSWVKCTNAGINENQPHGV